MRMTLLFSPVLLLFQVWPFVAWSVFVILMNAVPYSMLNGMQSSIALLNLINGVLLRHHHCFYCALVGALLSMVMIVVRASLF